MKQIFAGLIVTVVMTGGAVAGPFEEADAAYQRGDYATALALSQPLAGQGDASARGLLGAMSAAGQGLTQDYLLAAEWYRLAAEQGNAASHENLGAMYAAGQGVTRDYELAYMWFQRAGRRTIQMQSRAATPSPRS
jgi:TPR repeat protein